MGMRLNRLLAGPDSLDAGQWTAETITKRPALSCPGCSNVVELPHGYLIDLEGRVAPAWACSQCAFWEFVQLCDYAEEILK